MNDIERGDEKNTFELEDIKDFNNLPTLNYKLGQHLKIQHPKILKYVQVPLSFNERYNRRYGKIIFNENDSWTAVYKNVMFSSSKFPYGYKMSLKLSPNINYTILFLVVKGRFEFK